jgi:hypothetical protein
MRTLKYIIITFVLIIVQLSLMAQPLPPSSPGGNPVPVDGIAVLLLASIAGLGIVKLKRRKK